MPQHKHIKVAGRIKDVFAHRFVIETDSGRILADLGPKGAEVFPLKVGLLIEAEGESKPSELKVSRISADGGAPVEIEHKKKHEPHGHHDHHGPGDARDAKKAVEKAGVAPIGEPRRKPKHFEVLGMRGGRFVECHVEFDGHIRKEKPVAADDEKWARDLKTAA